MALSSQVAADTTVLQNLRSVEVDVPAQVTDVPLGVAVYLDRVVYTDRDRDGQALVVINPPSLLASGGLAGHHVRVWLQDDKGVAVGAPLQAAVTDSDHFALDMDLPRAPVGRFALAAALVDGQGKERARGARPFSKEVDGSMPPPPTADVPLILFADPSLLSYTDIPITTGIPLPDGMLHDPAQVSLLEDGVEIPCQTTVRARWTARGAVKWLGLDFLADYQNGEPKRYTLRLGTPPASKAGAPVSLRESPDAFVISNSHLQVRVGRRSFRLFDQVHLDRNFDGQFADDELIVEGGAGDGPYWVNAAGKAYRASLDRQPQVRVEEAGDLRVTLRADGWLTANDGEQAGLYTTRITLAAGQPQILVNQTYTITWDTLNRDNRVRDMGVSVSPVQMRQTEMGHYSGAVDLPETGGFYLLADRWNNVVFATMPVRKVLRTWTSDTLRHDRTTFLNFRHALFQGMLGPRGGVALAQRYLMQKFPKEISVTRNNLTWHAWPVHGTTSFGPATDIAEIANLRWLHQGELLDFQLPQEVRDAIDGFRKQAPDQEFDSLMGGARDTMAQGTAITGELVYHFAPPATDYAAFRTKVMPMAHVFEATPHAIADPNWVARTGVLEWIAPVDERYPNIERGISTYFDRAMAVIDDQRSYGQFLWPNGNQAYITGGSVASLHRNRVNFHHGAEMTGWILYLRSGDKKYWHFSRAWCRYLLDHASLNWAKWNPRTDPRPKGQTFPGAVYHCDGFVPWAPYDGEVLGHMSPQWHSALLYYLTGDSQAMDFLHTTARTVLKMVRTEQDYRVREPYGGMLNRNPACGWGMITHLYSELHDPRLLRPIGDIGRQIFDGKPLVLHGAPPEGQSGRWWWYTYLRHWRDPQAIKAIVDLSPTGGLSFAGYNMEHFHYTGNSRPIYALWAETNGLSPLRQFGMGHPYTLLTREQVADNINFLVPLIRSMTELNLPESPSPLPMSLDGKVRVVMRQESDHAFSLRFWGRAPEGEDVQPPVKWVLEGPDGQVVLRGELDRRQIGGSPDSALVVPVPADGKAGDYTFRFEPTVAGAFLIAPLSDLPKEVYVVPAGQWFSPGALCWRTGPNERQRSFSQFMRFGETYTALLRLETPQGYLVSEHASLLPIHLKVQPQTMYRFRSAQAGQIGYSWRWQGVGVPSLFTLPGPDMVLAADESRWFDPAP